MHLNPTLSLSNPCRRPLTLFVGAYRDSNPDWGLHKPQGYPLHHRHHIQQKAVASWCARQDLHLHVRNGHYPLKVARLLDSATRACIHQAILAYKPHNRSPTIPNACSIFNRFRERHITFRDGYIFLRIMRDSDFA